MASQETRKRTYRAKNVVPYNDASATKVAKKSVDKQTEYKFAESSGSLVPGLSLVVKPSGAASYMVRYQIGNGCTRQKRAVAIGRFGLLTLADARTKARGIMSAVENGADPVGDVGVSRAGLTLKQLFEQFEKSDRKRSPRTMSDYREHLDRDVFKPLGDLPVGELSAKAVAKVLATVEARSPNAAHKCRAALGSLYKWATPRFLVDANIMLGMGFTHKNDARKRLITDHELKALWLTIESDKFGASAAMRIILKLAILTGQRNSEIAGARVSELHIDPSIANPYWHIPAERMKRKTVDQFVFLSAEARELFAEAVALAGSSEFVFPATPYGKHVPGVVRQHITQESVSHAMARATKLAGIHDLHLHDMRKALATWLGERGERSDVLDRILHHHHGYHAGGQSSVTATHYNFSVMGGPLRTAWQAWADHVAQITDQQTGVAPTNIVPMRATA